MGVDLRNNDEMSLIKTSTIIITGSFLTATWSAILKITDLIRRLVFQLGVPCSLGAGPPERKRREIKLSAQLS